jgi:hypothetical protein
MASSVSYNKLERTKNMAVIANAQLPGERAPGHKPSPKVWANFEGMPRRDHEAKARTVAANLGYLLAWAELERTVGRAPGLGTP